MQSLGNLKASTQLDLAMQEKLSQPQEIGHFLFGMYADFFQLQTLTSNWKLFEADLKVAVSRTCEPRNPGAQIFSQDFCSQRSQGLT